MFQIFGIEAYSWCLNFRPNFIILKSLLTTALQHWDPRYVLHLMEETKRRGFSIDEAYILKIDRFIANVQKGLVFHVRISKQQDLTMTMIFVVLLILK